MLLTFKKRKFGPDGLGGAFTGEFTEEVTFSSAHAAIKWVKENSRRNETHWGWWWLECEMLPHWKASRETLNYISRVQNRHHNFVVYMRCEFGWEEIPDSTVHYMDNSTECRERNKFTGETRRKMLVAPHGDLC